MIATISATAVNTAPLIDAQPAVLLSASCGATGDCGDAAGVGVGLSPGVLETFVFSALIVGDELAFAGTSCFLFGSLPGCAAIQRSASPITIPTLVQRHANLLIFVIDQAA